MFSAQKNGMAWTTASKKNNDSFVSQQPETSRKSISQYQSYAKHHIYQTFEPTSFPFSLWCFFGSKDSEPLCDCEKINTGQCPLSQKWFQMLYEDSKMNNLKLLYHRYTLNNRIDHQFKDVIRKDIEKIKTTWPIVNSGTLEILLNNFAKHAIYYKKQPYLQAYAWLAAGILYHCESYKAFWILQAILDSLNIWQLAWNIQQESLRIYSILRTYFKTISSQMQKKGIDLRIIINYFLTDLLCSYTPIKYYGFNIQYLIQNGWKHLDKLILSFLDKRFQSIGNRSLSSKQPIIITLLNNDQKWPLIFCNMNAFKI